MLYDFRLPDIGEGVHEATILEWRRDVGDTVAEGEVLAVVETDKVVAEIPSPKGGIIRKLGAEPHTPIQVGEILARIDVSDIEGSTSRESVSVVGTVASSSTVLEASREGVAEMPSAGASAGETAERDQGAPTGISGRKPKATPVARRLASMEGIDIGSLQGTGPSGRILKEDVLRQIDTQSNDTSSRELSTLRRTVTRNLEASWKIPAAVIHDFAVVDDLVEARTALNRDRENSSHPKLSFLSFFVKAAAVSVKDYPLLNARYDSARQSIDPQQEANIGFALDTPQGLVVPVIEGADRLRLSEIQELINLRRREGLNREIRIENLRGGTFTISNYGSIGGTYGRPLILPPQVAILGLGRIHQSAVAKEGQLAVSTILPLSLVFDHRVCDGSYALRFLNRFIELVAKPIRLLG